MAHIQVPFGWNSPSIRSPMRVPTPLDSYPSACYSAPMTLSSNAIRELRDVSDELIGDTIGVCQAMDLIREDLAQLSRHLDARNYEAAAQMGYERLSADFIFLQRCLGGLSKSCNDRDAIIQAIAMERRTSFEEARPGAYAEMLAMQPKPKEGG